MRVAAVAGPALELAEALPAGELEPCRMVRPPCDVSRSRGRLGQRPEGPRRARSSRRCRPWPSMSAHLDRGPLPARARRLPRDVVPASCPRMSRLSTSRSDDIAMSRITTLERGPASTIAPRSSSRNRPAFRNSSGASRRTASTAGHRQRPGGASRRATQPAIRGSRPRMATDRAGRSDEQEQRAQGRLTIIRPGRMPRTSVVDQGEDGDRVRVPAQDDGSRRTSSTRTKPITALMTMAPRTACGRSANSGSSATEVSDDEPGDDDRDQRRPRPGRGPMAALWLAPPATMKPWNRPARMFEPPFAISSWSGAISSRCSSANRWATVRLSALPTIEIAIAPGIECQQLLARSRAASAGSGTPPSTDPDDLHALGRQGRAGRRRRSRRRPR